MKVMRLQNIIAQKSLFFCLFLLSVIFSIEAGAQKRTDKKIKPVNIALTVTDEAGKPLHKAQVVVGEGIIHTETGENGTVTFEALPQDAVTITSPGYDRVITLAEQILQNKTVRLHKAKLFMTSDDNVPLPFMTQKRRQLTSSSYVIRGNELESYPSTDLRNAFTGLAPGLEVKERNGSPGLTAEEKLNQFGISEKVSFYTRGRSPIFIIDDIPTDITEMQLDPQEIETATLLKDITAKAMFGPQAADGVIYIKTKRGRKNERILNVDAESGINIIDRFPEWASGADYARLNNLARASNGLDPRYSDEAIAEYAKNDPYNMYFPSNNFRNMMLKNSMPFRRVHVSSTGGNDVVQYHSSLGYNSEGDIYKIGPDADFNRLSTRSNIDIKINDLLKLQFDFYGGLTFRRSPNYDYDGDFGADNSNDGAMDIVEFNRVVDDINTISPIAFPIYAGYDSASNTPWFGVDPSFRENPIGELTSNGYYTESGRNGAANIALDYDMSPIIKGLKSRTYIGFNVFNLLRIGKAEEYIAYNVSRSVTPAGKDTILLTKAHDGKDMSGQAKLHDYYYQRFSFYENLSYEKAWNNSLLQSSLTYYLSNGAHNGIEEPERQQNLVLSALYSHKDKYSLQGVLNYAGTYSLDTGERYAFFPSVGASWVVSEENFMSGVQFIDYLKLRAEAGILGYEGFLAPYYYRDNWSYNSSGGKWGPAPTGYWFGSAEDKTGYRTNPSRKGNPDLTWEKRKEITVGLDALMFNRKLFMEVNYYNNLRDGIITRLANTIPYMLGISGARPWANYNKIRYYGVETSLRYNNKVGNLRYSIGGNATWQTSKILKYDQPNYRFDYQSRIGKPADAYWGLTYLGRFASDEETLATPQLYDEQLSAGDLKYKDLNNDGVVDDNDASMIGHTSPRLVYALNVKLSYRDFDLTIIGDGRAFVDLALTNKYFWNGWGDNTYSKFVMDNIDGAYPKLTYYKVNNNFVGSNFWLTNGGYFKIQNVELAYNVPAQTARSLFTRGIRLFLRGANLATISDVKYVDPESRDSGVELYPLFRTFTGGVKLTF